jgi:sulfite reductase beta subunit-like hemoprotein
VPKNGRKVKVALKYCGSCNPQVDLTSIARHLAKVAETRGDFQLVPLPEDGINIVVILCGCPRACGNKPEVRARAGKSLLTAGESINGRHVPEAQLPSTVEQELIKILDSLTCSKE